MVRGKALNHRSPVRVLRLINKIRSEADGHQQEPREGANEGCVRFFIASASTADKSLIERKATERMAAVTLDNEWLNSDAVKALTLEHHMAARRLGFFEMFDSLYKADKLRTGLLDGKLSGLTLFSSLVLPLRNAATEGDTFAVAAILRQHSPLLDPELLRKSANQLASLQNAKNACESVTALFANGSDPSFRDVLHRVGETNLFPIPRPLLPFSTPNQVEESSSAGGSASSEATEDSELPAWDSFLDAPFSQIESYAAYVNHVAAFDTHQGVKGLEFPRVMVIIDDSEAKGFMFKYDKLFGLQGKSKTDIENENAGKETVIDRTRRLFYVVCSRAKESLAIVAYTEQTTALEHEVISNGWFEQAEVERLQ